MLHGGQVEAILGGSTLNTKVGVELCDCDLALSTMCDQYKYLHISEGTIM